MENGVSKVEEVKPKVEEIDNDVLGDGMKGIETDDVESVSATIEVEETPLKEANGDVESVSTTIEAEETPGKDGSDANGVNPVVSLELDGSVDAGQSVVEKFEDAIETPYETQTAMENTHVDPVEEAISPKVIDEDTTSVNTINDQPIVIANDKLVDSDEHEAKELNLAYVTEDKSASVNTLSDIPSNLEANEAVNDDSIEAKVGESTSDNATKLVSVTDEQNTYTDVIKDDQNVLENNGVVDNGVNEVTNVSDPKVEDQMTILEDIHHKKPVDVILPNSENGVSDDIHLEENLIHEDHINGDSMSHKTQPDGELGVEVNGDVPSQLHEKEMLVTEGKDDDTKNVENPTDNLHNIQNEPKVEKSQVLEQKTSAPSSEQVSTSAINEPNSKPEIPKVETLPSEKTEPKDHEVKQDNIIVKKEPVIGVSLPTEKPATSTPIPNPKPTQPSIPNSKPTVTPPPAQTRPAGLGNAAPLLEPAHRVVPSQPNGNVPPQNQVIDEPTNEPEENDDTREKLQMIRVKFLRLARRLGQTPHNVVVAQVLYRLGLAEQLRGRNGGRVAAFSFERASAMAEQLESTGQEPLEFSCTIMVLGKTGVGKSATINSIFDENKFSTDAFQLGTKKVQDVVGTVQGIKVRVIDTPGLLSSWNDQRKNEKILHSVKKFIQKSPPDIVLYLDRLDMQSRDFGDMPLLRTITDIFGQSIWFNAIVVLTHAASAPPEGPNGTTTSYDMFVTQRSHVVQQAIRQAAGDMRLMNPVSLVENHSACRTNRAGQRVLPNGQVWKPHLLLLSFASKILVEANMLLKLQDSPPGKPFGGQRTRAPPLPFILSNLLQSRPQLNLPNEQFGDEDDVDDDDDVASDDEVSEYDELPPFKRLTSVQLAKLSKAQKKAYFDELEYREKLFMKKQLKEEKKRRKLMKKMAEEAKNFPEEIGENLEEDGNAAATVPVAVQDMNLPVSFDADNPTHRYRALDSANQWLIRPVLDPHGWDHDVGYEGINIEHLLALQEKIPVSFSGQVTKDKKDANLQMEVSTGVKHGKSKSKSTTVAFDMQTVGKDISYTLRSETRFLNYKKNKASAGFSVTHFGDSVTGGVKFEDKLVINRRGQVVVAGGAVMGRGDVAYGGSLEATLRDKDYPLGRFLSTVGLSVMDWHGDLAIGWNAQSQIPIGRFTNLIGRVNLNNKGSGQVSVRLNSSEQLQIALVAFVPVVCKLIGYYQPRDTSY